MCFIVSCYDLQRVTPYQAKYKMTPNYCPNQQEKMSSTKLRKSQMRRSYEEEGALDANSQLNRPATRNQLGNQRKPSTTLSPQTAGKRKLCEQDDIRMKAPVRDREGKEGGNVTGCTRYECLARSAFARDYASSCLRTLPPLEAASRMNLVFLPQLILLVQIERLHCILCLCPVTLELT